MKNILGHHGNGQLRIASINANINIIKKAQISPIVNKVIMIIVNDLNIFNIP